MASCLECKHYAWPDWCGKKRRAIPGNTTTPEWCPVDANDRLVRLGRSVGKP